MIKVCFCLVKITVIFHLSTFLFFFQMGNASESYLFVSRISKNNDFLMGTLYTIFGKLN